MLKKMLLLTSMVLAVTAFAVPAPASAQVWTHEGGSFTGTKHDTLSGFIAFGNPEPGATKFGCFAHAGVTFHGGSSTATLTSFEPTTSTCVGEGTFAGCELVEDSTTIPADTTIHLTGTNTSTLTTPEPEEETNPIVIHNHYDANCPITKSTLTVEELTLTGTNSNLTDVTITGTGVSHVTLKNPPITLAPQTVGVFGTMGTATDTITVS